MRPLVPAPVGPAFLVSVRTPSRRALRGLVATLAVAIDACGSSQPGPALSLPPPSSLPASATSHVAVIVMENREYGEVIGSRHAPYLNSLARRYAAPSRLYAIRHPSLPNYIALTSGDTHRIASDCTSCHVRATNLVDQFDGAGVTWKAYMQGMPHACYRGAESGGYAKKHNPFLYFDDVAHDRARCGRIVPYGRLGADLRKGRLPDFVWITPDLCNDTHDCSVRTGDRFLSHLVPAILRELGPHGILFVTWDEGSSDRRCCGVAHGGRIATVVAGPDVRPGARGGGPYTQYSILRTIEDALGLSRLGHAGDAGTLGLDDLFTRPPRARPLSRAP